MIHRIDTTKGDEEQIRYIRRLGWEAEVLLQEADGLERQVAGEASFRFSRSG